MKLTISVTATVVFLICAAGIGQAQGINWNSQSFGVSAEANWWDDEDINSEHIWNADFQYTDPLSPPISWPLNASSLAENYRLVQPGGFPIQYAESNATFDIIGIDSYSITMNTRAEDYSPYFPTTGSDATALATGFFDASFTATQPFLIFGYDLEYSISALGTSSAFDFESLASNGVMVRLSVTSNKSEVPYLYEELIATEVEAVGDTGGAITDGDRLTGSFTIPVNVGDNISVILELSEDAYAEFASEAGNNTLTLDFALASVAPEPLSTALFLVGGATFGFGAYRRRQS